MSCAKLRQASLLNSEFCEQIVNKLCISYEQAGTKLGQAQLQLELGFAALH